MSDPDFSRFLVDRPGAEIDLEDADITDGQRAAMKAWLREHYEATSHLSLHSTQMLQQIRREQAEYQPRHARRTS